MALGKLDQIKLGGFLGISVSEKVPAYKDKTEQTLDFYASYLKSQELLTEVSFSQGNRQGLFFYKDNVQVILPRAELQYDVRFDFESIEYMCRKYTVMVKAVDRENGIVTLSFKQAQDKAKPEVINAIKTLLAAGTSYRALARISYITSREKGICHVDIMGIGLHGIITVAEWSPSFTPDMRMVTKKGDIIEILVTNIVRGKDRQELYICSRKQAMSEDPWEGVEMKAPKTTTVLIKCLRKYENHFIGAIEGLAELSCYCHYPKPGTINSHTGQSLIINTGGVYSGYVANVSEEKHILRVRILDEVTPGADDDPEEPTGVSPGEGASDKQETDAE